MPSMWGSRKKRDDRGAAAVETALCLCFLVAPLVFATIAYAYMFSFRQALSQAASEGARAAVGGSTLAVQQSSAQDAIKNALSSYGMTCGSDNLTCTIVQTTANCPSTRTCLSVTVTYPYRDHSLLPTIPGLGFTLPANLAFTTVVQVS